jgi:hypothetical protein
MCEIRQEETSSKETEPRSNVAKCAAVLRPFLQCLTILATSCFPEYHVEHQCKQIAHVFVRETGTVRTSAAAGRAQRM